MGNPRQDRAGTEALASIERATPGLCKNIPPENCGWFVAQIRHAVEDYFEHPRARELAEEIRVFARALRGPPANVLAAFDSLSPVNLEMISLLGDLPDRNQLANPRTQTEGIKKLRSLIVTGAYVARAEDNKTKNPRKRILKGTEPPSQNRKKEKLVGQNQLRHAAQPSRPPFVVPSVRYSRSAGLRRSALASMSVRPKFGLRRKTSYPV